MFCHGYIAERRIVGVRGLVFRCQYPENILSYQSSAFTINRKTMTQKCTLPQRLVLLQIDSYLEQATCRHQKYESVLPSFQKRILDTYTRNTLSYVLPASGVQDVTYVSFNGESGKGRLRLGGGILLFVAFHLVLGESYQPEHCPVSCSSGNIYLFQFILLSFVFFL